MTDLKPCKSCEKEVARTARKCPQCGAANPGIDEDEAKKNLLKIAGFFLVVIVACVLIFG